MALRCKSLKVHRRSGVFSLFCDIILVPVVYSSSTYARLLSLLLSGKIAPCYAMFLAFYGTNHSLNSQ